MARRIELGTDALLVRYDALGALLRVAREVRVPYAAIRSVEVGLRELPGAFAFRIGLNSGPFSDHRLGRFWIDGKREFYDVSDRRRAVVIDLEPGREYERVVLEPDTDPEQLAGELRARVTPSA